MVDIVIPIYREVPTAEEAFSLERCFSVLGGHPLTFIHPQSLNLSAYQKYQGAAFRAFDDDFFTGIFGYNRLMLSVGFYQAFHREYILIYQPDCLVFRDELDFWVAQGYDYIGAPWLRSRAEVPLVKKIWDGGWAWVKTQINHGGNGRVQKDKSLLYNAVGNGGFSLRRRQKFIEVLEKLAPVVQVYLKPENQSTFYAEDVFFSIEPQRHGLAFSKPDYRTACRFAIENKPEFGLNLNNGKLPFGCHRWNKENREFWMKILMEWEENLKEKKSY